MPALVNYSDDEFYSAGAFCSNTIDLGLLYSIGSHVDTYSPACKRARISPPFVFESFDFEQNKKPSIEVLPDECLYEIFRRIPGGKERISCASVSKRWLMLLCSIRKAEVWTGKTVATREEKTVVSTDVEMVSCDGNEELEDGYLTRSLDGKKATDIRLAAFLSSTDL